MIMVQMTCPKKQETRKRETKKKKLDKRYSVLQCRLFFLWGKACEGPWPLGQEKEGNMGRGV